MIDYFNFHSLKMNPNKTEFMVFGNPGEQKQIIVNDEVIKEVKEVKYLDVTSAEALR